MHFELVQLVILFFVIFDPPASLLVFFTSTRTLTHAERTRTGIYAVLIAAGLSFTVLFAGEALLALFNTSIDEFRIAGGIILALLGIRMTFGSPLLNIEHSKNNKGMALSALIATPFLTGPAAITAIIVSTRDFGYFLTSASITIVLCVTALMFHFSEFFNRTGKTPIQVLSTIFGLVTLSWGVRFVIDGLKALIL